MLTKMEVADWVRARTAARTNRPSRVLYGLVNRIYHKSDTFELLLITESGMLDFYAHISTGEMVADYEGEQLVVEAIVPAIDAAEYVADILVYADVEDTVLMGDLVAVAAKMIYDIKYESNQKK